MAPTVYVQYRVAKNRPLCHSSLGCADYDLPDVQHCSSFVPLVTVSSEYENLIYYSWHIDLIFQFFYIKK